MEKKECRYLILTKALLNREEFRCLINNQDCGDIVGHVGLHCVCRYCSPVEYAKHKWQGKPSKHQGCRLSIYILKKTLFFFNSEESKTKKRDTNTERYIQSSKAIARKFPFLGNLSCRIFLVARFQKFSSLRIFHENFRSFALVLA